MAVQVYNFKVTYEGCDNRIRRDIAVSSNYRLADIGCAILATFDTRAYHLFEMKFKDMNFVLSEEEKYDTLYSGAEHCELLFDRKIGELDMKPGESIEMVYDFGCEQVFDIRLMGIEAMPKGHGRAYPKILDGAGSGIIDDMSAEDLLEVIKRIDAGESSGIRYSKYDLSPHLEPPEWDYRKYDIESDNALFKGEIDLIREAYESC